MEEQQCISLKIPSNYIYISPIRTFVKQLAKRLEFSEMRIEDIELAVDEICNNAIEHGSCGMNSEILLVFTLNDNRLDLLVRDKGKHSGESSWLHSGRVEEVERQMSPQGERGHGIFLAKVLADEMNMEPNDQGGTDVRMVFFKDSPDIKVGEEA